jgi:hypothetical protein
MDNRQVIIHDKPHPDNNGKHGRLRMLTTTDTEIHYWKCPYRDPQIARDRRNARIAKQSRLTQLEAEALKRGGSVTDIHNRKEGSA